MTRAHQQTDDDFSRYFGSVKSTKQKIAPQPTKDGNSTFDLGKDTAFKQYVEDQVNGQLPLHSKRDEVQKSADVARENVLQFSTDYDGKIVYGGQLAEEEQEEEQMMNKSGQWLSMEDQAADDDNMFGLGFDTSLPQMNAGTVQMFYGDYKCGEDDEPVEDDMSNGQFSKSQFSEDISQGGAEDAESEIESPSHIANNTADREQEINDSKVPNDDVHNKEQEQTIPMQEQEQPKASQAEQ